MTNVKLKLIALAIVAILVQSVLVNVNVAGIESQYIAMILIIGGLISLMVSGFNFVVDTKTTIGYKTLWLVGSAMLLPIQLINMIRVYRGVEA